MRPETQGVMRRISSGVAIGLIWLAGGLEAPARAEGFWVSLAAAAANSAVPSDYQEFWFDTQHGPPLAIVTLSGIPSAQATTGGGTTVFSPLGTPVLLPTDGYSTIRSSNQLGGDVPPGAIPRFAGGNQASGPPQTGLPVPADANRLGISVTPPAADGSRVVTVDVHDPQGNWIGSGQVTVPDGGWWVIGLGPGNDAPTGNGGNPPEPPPILLPPSNNDDPANDNDVDGEVIIISHPPAPPEMSPGDNALVTPEPNSIVMAALGGASVALYRRTRRNRSNHTGRTTESK